MKFSGLENKAATKGFTLIEILIVIGIIAVLAAVVLVAINPARQFAQANNSQRTSNVNAILSAVGQYMVDHHGDLPDGITGTKQEIGTALCEDIVSMYIPALPTDPKSDSNGASIEEADCSSLGTNDVDYQIEKGADDRITVYAPNAEIEATIKVTR